MTTSAEALIIRDARAQYFAENGFGDGGYTATWVKVQAGPLPIYFPNTAARVRAVRLHDLHHVVTGYDTMWTGEENRRVGDCLRLCPSLCRLATESAGHGDWVGDRAAGGLSCVRPWTAHEEFVSRKRSHSVPPAKRVACWVGPSQRRLVAVRISLPDRLPLVPEYTVSLFPARTPPSTLS